jgi:hypothetical protein
MTLPINAMTVEAIQKQFGAFVPNKYGLVQYSQTKYGRYDIEGDYFTHPLLQLRIRSGNTYIYSQTTVLWRPVSMLRIRSNNSNWIYSQSIPYTEHHDKWRIRSKTSGWVYSQTITKEQS